MNETTRTLVFVGVAAICGLAAYGSLRDTKQTEVKVPPTGLPLFPDFKDPLAAKSLEIVMFDDATAELRPFKVAQERGQWVIPSHGDYPADAENQLRDAAASLIDLKALAIASEVVTDHVMFGVIEPNQAKLKVGDKGVGTLVAVQDAKENDLMRLVVGEEVDGRPGQRFVRKPSEEVVYVAKIDLAKLSTDFDTWIEKDLLKLSPFDVSKVTLKDYSLFPTGQGQQAYLPRMDATLTYDSAATNQWTLDKMTVYSREGEPREAPLSDQEELNKQKLDDLRNGLDDLKIVNVSRKPEELGNLLKEGLEKVEASELESLQTFGFVPARGPDGKFDVFASNGELIVDMKDGVRYVLRFGKVAGTQKASSAGSSAKTGDDPADGSKTGDAADDAVKVNRYLFVSAQLSPLTLTQPMLEPEPAGPENPPADAPADKPAGEKAADAEKDEKPADAAADPAKAERERIKRENERKMNDYRDKKIKAEVRVKELNARFADWYYVVSEDVYKKLRLSRSDFVKEAATASEEGFGIDAFRKLEDDGIEGAAAPMTTPMPMTPGFPPLP